MRDRAIQSRKEMNEDEPDFSTKARLRLVKAPTPAQLGAKVLETHHSRVDLLMPLITIRVASFDPKWWKARPLLG